MRNPIKILQAWIDRRIARAVRRELNIIFRKDGKIAVDHHLRSDSWAVIKVDVGDTCYLKFLNLDKPDLKQLQNYLRIFEDASVDSTPDIMRHLNNSHRFNTNFFEI